ncbi:MAG: hypothetical protein Q9195_008847 [Heterodermia aff. obscurata]
MVLSESKSVSLVKADFGLHPTGLAVFKPDGGESDSIPIAFANDPRIPPRIPRTWPLGESQPPCNEHIIQTLAENVLSRYDSSDVGCVVFPSASAAERCVKVLGIKKPLVTLSVAKFTFPKPLPSGWNEADAQLIEFHVVLYPHDTSSDILAFWRQTGDGISSRHAQYCLRFLAYLETISDTPQRWTAPRNKYSGVPKLIKSDSAELEKHAVKSFIAELATSPRVQQKVSTDDVFLYAKGLSAIYAVSRALIAYSGKAEQSVVVIYGWPYAETVKCIELSGWGQIILHGHGSSAELDEVEKALQSGLKLTALFCELPSNPQLASPDLERIRGLADRYNFIVACDETLGTFVNVDVLPYADIVMTSLTKIFSGASDVMGGR